MNENGELRSIEGYPVLDAGGAPIQLDPRGGPPKAGADGALRQGDQLVGAIGLFDFDPGRNFVRYGNSGIVPQREPEPVTDRADVGVAQGFVERRGDQDARLQVAPVDAGQIPYALGRKILRLRAGRTAGGA
jgi:flagellar basal-body rod protein FlgF